MPHKTPDHILGMSAEQLIRQIATDYIELSHDKIKWLYLEHIQWCRDWMAANASEDAGGEIVEQKPIDDNF